MFEVLIGIVIVGVIVCLPLLLLALLFKVVVTLLLLPFKLVGALFGAVGHVVGFAAKGVLLLLAVLAGLALLAGGVLFVGLLPFVVLGLIVWALVRVLRPRPAVQAAA